MDERQKEQFFTEFNNSLHRLGKMLLIVSMILLVSVPFVIGAINGVAPELGGFLSGMAKVGIIYIPVAIVEFLVYTPMLGVGGSYISFLTGNVTNMKIPCAMNARDMAGTTVGTPENEIISTNDRRSPEHSCASSRKHTDITRRRCHHPLHQPLSQGGNRRIGRSSDRRNKRTERKTL